MARLQSATDQAPPVVRAPGTTEVRTTRKSDVFSPGMAASRSAPSSSSRGTTAARSTRRSASAPPRSCSTSRMPSPRARRQPRARSCARARSLQASGGPLVGVRINAPASGLADADLDGAGPGALAHRPDHGAHGRGARRDPSRGRTARRARAGGRVCPRAESTCSRWPRPRAACSRRARSPSPRRALRTFIFGPGRSRPGARRGADRRRLRAPPRPLGDRAGGSRGRQAGPRRRPVSQARRRRGLRGLLGLGAATRLSGQGRPAPAPAADRGRRVRDRASASSPGRARSTARLREAEAAGLSSIKLADGTFVDYPVAQRARDILRASDR